jgi:hypothetical protein
VAVVAIVFGIVLFCLRRAHHRYLKPLPCPPSYELSNEQSRIAAAVRTSTRVREPEKVAAAEIGRNSMYMPPVELPGDSLVTEDKKGINPLVKLYAVR